MTRHLDSGTIGGLAAACRLAAACGVTADPAPSSPERLDQTEGPVTPESLELFFRTLRS